ncbi:hypothetical protein HDU87_001835 [Geranomyces variabilis]|uniref:Uncharacterized protein n=1 Tax=Geranomyces variabilis TaxID=109894 RepID=A0AAD5XSG3_9FUNG|nr:hypothetical protein HDU87_001835 [Geranomyces variabilis]
MTHPTLLRVGNTLAFLLFFSSSIYNVAGPDAGDLGGVYALHPTYLTPAPFTFAIWGLVYFMFAGFIVWQWFAEKSESDAVVVDGYGSYFILAAVLTSVWHNLWTSNHLVLSEIILLFASASITVIYHNLNAKPAHSAIEQLFVHSPISLLHGFLVFVNWLNIFAIFTTVKDAHHPSVWHQIAVFAILTKLTFTAMAYTEVKNYQHGDIAGSFAIVWSMIGVAVQQENKFIMITAIVGAALSALYAFKPQVFKKNVTNGEHQPLLGATDNQV